MNTSLLRNFALLAASFCAAGLYAAEPLPFYTDFTQKDIASKFTIIDANPGTEEEFPFTWVIGTQTVDFDDPDAEALFEYLNQNFPQWRDGVDTDLNICAVYNGYRRSDYMHKPHRAGDDYLITPAFRAFKDNEYTLSFTAISNVNMNTGNDMDIYVGYEPTENGMLKGIKIGSVRDIQDGRYLDENPGAGDYSFKFKAPENGDMYIGFHSKAAADQIFWIRKIEVSAEATADAPGEVTIDSAKGGDKGALVANITFTLPTKTRNGNKLDNIDLVSIFRDDVKIAVKEFENPEVGATLSFEDNFEGVENPGGPHTYNIMCQNKNGNNDGMIVRLWVGEDYSAPVKNLRVSETEDSYVLTWNAPTESLNGEYIDFDNLQYTVLVSLRAGNIGTNPTNVVTTRELTASVDKNTFDGIPGQIFITFYVVPVTSTGCDLRNSTASVRTVGGEIYTIGFSESFAQGTIYTDPWTVNECPELGLNYLEAWSFTGERYEVFGLDSQDNDGGYAVYENQTYPEYALRLVSPFIDVADAADPEVSFYLGTYALKENDFNKMQIELLDLEGNYISVGEPIHFSGSGWKHHVVPLKNDKNVSKFRLSFRAQGVQYAFVLLDNISVRDNKGGVEFSETDSTDIRSGKGFVEITGNCPYSIFTASGNIVAHGECDGFSRLNMASGLYIVKAGEKNIKCIVK